MRKDFSRLPGEHIITWLLRCWDNGASSLELEGREAKQLGSLSREGGIDKAIGKKAQALSLWRRLLSSVKERYPFREDVICRPGKWTTMERGIQYLRELAVQEMVYYDLDNAQLPTDPDEVQLRKSNGEWRLTVDYRGLNEVTLPMSAARPDMLELQYELESKAAKWYATIDIANAFFSIPLAAECRPEFAFTWRGVQYTWNRLPQGWKHSPTICHGLIQTALEKGEAPEHLQYIDAIIVWGNSAEEVSEKGKKIIQILLQAGFAIKRSKVKGPAQEIQFLGIRWQDGRRQIPMNVINKIAAMSPLTNKKETQAFSGLVGFW
ncbi:macrophage immunometabolism regulator [Grus japonensis]|uniref:ribonuclease H n=1 Tax=Grus japonensis TaxID=30415 RepID=A0ABC9Y4R9_GRUJA